MIKLLPKYMVIFIVCILLQIFIFNEMQLSRFFNPSFYILFIILLPFETPKWLQLISGFILGFIIDATTNTMGIHTAATVLISFTRPIILNLYSPREGYEPGSFPRIHDLNIAWFIKYTLSIVFIHQISLYFIEAMSFNFFGMTLFVSITNTLITSFFIILSQFIMFKR
jgi:hypothetical protein